MDVAYRHLSDRLLMMNEVRRLALKTIGSLAALPTFKQKADIRLSTQELP